MGLLRMTFSGEIVSLLYPSGSSEQDREFVHKPKKKPLWKNGRFQAQLVSGDRFVHVAEVTKTNQGIDLCIDLRGQDLGGNRHSSGDERQMHNRGNSSRKEASIPDNVGDENQLVDYRGTS
ncbi:hypothetical protein Q3G72_015692 [Acer saccharum]|nr:hypothetical protein Q3G72_015692 [Acer saccharum]